MSLWAEDWHKSLLLVLSGYVGLTKSFKILLYWPLVQEIKKKVKVIITKINLFYPKQNVTPFCAGFGTEYPNIYL